MSAYYIYVSKCMLFCSVEHSGSESTHVKKFSIQREKGSTSNVNQSPAVGWRRNTCTWLITSSVDIDHLQLVSVQICNLCIYKCMYKHKWSTVCTFRAAQLFKVIVGDPILFINISRKLILKNIEKWISNLTLPAINQIFLNTH